MQGRRTAAEPAWDAMNLPMMRERRLLSQVTAPEKGAALLGRGGLAFCHLNSWATYTSKKDMAHSAGDMATLSKGLSTWQWLEEVDTTLHWAAATDLTACRTAINEFM